jgi:hypothetical protein
MRINFFILLILVFWASCQSCFLGKTQTVTKEQAWTKAIDFAQTNLEKNGKLMQQADGFAYIKVDDAYIHDLYPLLDLDKDFKEPPYFRRPNAPGAHISVFYENENIKVQEVGESFSFTLRNIEVVKVGKNKTYIVLVVDAPKLEQLRKKYGLTPKLKNHEFHITIAKKLSH